ncbi:hypothetical protein [Phytoactinopolyspora endophytica]|uniref:hypothetical protein n=1 Tax=Phytoactinopolyspora endophytica TaxID=1642495 RepID=UPI00101CE686|nr:hypothetical protein [Phytoactinopolyspora endophytica]
MPTRQSIGLVTVGLAAVLVSAAGAVAHADAQPGAMQRDAQPEGTQNDVVPIDFDELEQGSGLAIAWFADDAFHRYNVSWDVETEPLEAFAEVEGMTPSGPEEGWVGLTNPPGDESRQIVEYERDNDGNVILEVVREGDLGHLVASADGRYYAYVEDGEDVFVSSPSGGFILRHDDAYPVGFADGLIAINDVTDGEPSVHLHDYICDDEDDPDSCRDSRIDDVVGATATSDTTGLIAVTGEDEDGDVYSAILDTSDDNREVWRSYERRVESFSPNGAYAATVDIRSDGLGYTDVEIIGAWEGETRLRAEMDVSQRLAWEPANRITPGNQLVFDAWDDGEQALVRCDVSAGCELATEPASAEDPVELPPHLLVSQ